MLLFTVVAVVLDPAFEPPRQLESALEPTLMFWI